MNRSIRNFVCRIVFFAGCSLLSLWVLDAGALNMTSAGSVSVAPGPMAAADFNRDGKQDIAVLDADQGRAALLLGNGLGGFAPPAYVSVGQYPTAVVASDFNGDGNPDLATANSALNFITTPGAVNVLLGDGAGGFGPAAAYTVGKQPKSIVVADFNRDGKADLATCDRFSDRVSVMLGNGDGTFSQASGFATGWRPNGVVVGDFNQDSKIDLATADGEDATASILLGNGAGGLAPAVAYGAGSFPMSIAAGDVNGDGKLDLVLPNDGTDHLTLLLGNGNGTFQAGTVIQAGEFPVAALFADLDRDGGLDILAVRQVNGGAGENSVSFLKGTASGNFEAAVGLYTTSNFGIQTLYLAMADFNRDGKPDLAIADAFSGNVAVLLNRVLKGDLDADNSVGIADAILALQISAGVTPSGPVFAGADVDGDGRIGAAEIVCGLQSAAGIRP